MSSQDTAMECIAKLSPEFGKLIGRARETLLANIAMPGEGGALPWSPLRGICPSTVPPGYPGIWNWDAAFHAIGVARWDAVLAREQIRIILDAQLPSGGLPDVLYLNGKSVTAFGKPPVMPWAAMFVDRMAPDDDFVAYAYPRFVRFEEFLRRERGGDAHGLFHYDSSNAEKRLNDSRFESGWDNSVRWDHASFTYWPVDLNGYMVLLYQAMAYMASRAGLCGEVERWHARAREMGRLINEKLFDERRQCYVDFNYEAKSYSSVITPASLVPLYARIAPVERAAAMAEVAADPAKLSPGFPTVAYDDPEYRSDKYWRGPMWLNTAYFALKGLKWNGYVELADAGRDTVLAWCSQNTDYIYEYYDSTTGKGFGKKQFGWSAAFILQFILGWDDETA